jgi:squalene-hopene/tetraprenyl-beta-curcumene cyclase
MAAGEVGSEAVRRGVAFLESHPRRGANWQETFWTGTGFPRVFYLKYHGYSAYFPLWALARYRRLVQAGGGRPEYGL